MGYYDEDFYNEPSEFESQILALKESLAESIKNEYVKHMERLGAENDELRIVKKNFDTIKREYEEKHRQLEYERKDLERKVRAERLSTLMKDFQVVMYQPYGETVTLPKCDKCNEYRKIEYITPLGRKAQEDCECAKRRTVYEPKECRCSSFKISEDKNTLDVWYKMVPEEEYDYAVQDSHFAKIVYDESIKFDSIDPFDRNHLYFKIKEECQRYCDYLNSDNR